MGKISCCVTGLFAAFFSLSVSPAYAEWPPEIASLFGQPGVAAFCGNGLLAAGVDTHGRLAVCRWPGPGAPNQLDFVPDAGTDVNAVPGSFGALWGVRFKDGFTWIGWGTQWTTVQQYADDGSGAIETHSNNATSGIKVVQRVFTPPSRPLLVSQIEIQGTTEVPSCFWYANFSPSMRHVKGLPVTEIMFPGQRDFAIFTDDGGKTFHQFRPVQPGSIAWETARRISEGRVAPAKKKLGWEQFEDCVWIAFARVNGETANSGAFQCGYAGNVKSAFPQAEQDTLRETSSAVGQCDVAFKVEPQQRSGVYSATVLIAFGKSRSEADKILNDALEGSAGLYEEARQAWLSQRQTLRLPNPSPAIHTCCERMARRLLMCRDSASGAFVQSPVTSALSALARSQDSALIALALDMIGQREFAETQTLFWCTAIRAKDEPGKPGGSVAAALYTDGKEAAPSLLLEADASAWVLGSVWRHATFLEGDARRAYLEKTWDAVVLAGDFLAGWVDARNREPFPSFDAHAFRDRQSQGLLLTVYMGVDSALRIATALERKNPDTWLQRKRDLDVLIRLQCVDEQGAWKGDTILPFWRPEFARTELPAWSGLIERRVAETSVDNPDAVLLCDAALVWQGTNALEGLKPMLEKAITREQGTDFDALYAARCLIAATTIYPPVR